LSIEIRESYPCPHLIVEERVALGPDKMAVPIRAPVAVADSVRVLVNDSHYVPKNGLYAQAALTASLSGPYNIQRCTDTLGPQGNVVRIQTSVDTTDVSIPTGSRVTAEAVVSAIRGSSSQVVVGLSPTNALVLLDPNNVGTKSLVRISRTDGGVPSIGVLAALGFDSQQGARGQMVYPPWQLQTRQDVFPTTMEVGRFPVKARYPKFIAPLKGNPTVKVSYVSFPERCPRCQGTYVENDYRFDKSGAVITIDNENLLYQACLKMLLTEVRSNPYHPRYGSGIMGMIGMKRMGAAATLIQEKVQQALEKVQNLQNGQRKFQRVTDRERLYAVLNVNVSSPPSDPTAFQVDVVVQNASQQRIPISIAFSVPGAVALAGSTGASLGAQPTDFGPKYRNLVGE
jgi:hypothetical protein